MPSNQTNFLTGTVTITYAQNIKITNLSIPLANTEYSHALSTNLRSVIIRARGITDTQIAFVSGESGTKYITIPKKSNLILDSLDLTGTTLYAQCDQASQVLEILETY